MLGMDISSHLNKKLDNIMVTFSCSSHQWRTALKHTVPELLEQMKFKKRHMIITHIVILGMDISSHLNEKLDNVMVTVA